MRKVILANDEIYHIYNLGVERRPTFTDKREYDRALLTLDYYRNAETITGLAQVLRLDSEKRDFFFSQLAKRNEKLIDVLCYCFMPNHFHFLLKQLIEGGIQTFVSNFSNSYTRYFNVKRKRIGPLFQGAFKAVRIEDNEQLIHVSRYIHLNPVTSLFVKESDLENYHYCSFKEYISGRAKICDTNIVLNQFPSVHGYKKFVYDQVEYGKRLELIKHLTFE